MRADCFVAYSCTSHVMITYDLCLFTSLKCIAIYDLTKLKKPATMITLSGLQMRSLTEEVWHSNFIISWTFLNFLELINHKYNSRKHLLTKPEFIDRIYIYIVVDFTTMVEIWKTTHIDAVAANDDDDDGDGGVDCVQESTDKTQWKRTHLRQQWQWARAVSWASRSRPSPVVFSLCRRLTAREDVDVY